MALKGGVCVNVLEFCFFPFVMGRFMRVWSNRSGLWRFLKRGWEMVSAGRTSDAVTGWMDGWKHWGV